MIAEIRQRLLEADNVHEELLREKGISQRLQHLLDLPVPPPTPSPIEALPIIPPVIMPPSFSIETKTIPILSSIQQSNVLRMRNI